MESLVCESEGDHGCTLEDDDIHEHPTKMPKSHIWGEDSDNGEMIQQELIMSVLYSNGLLGLSFYDVETGTLNIMVDTAETKDYELFKRVIYQIQPSVILTSSKQDDYLQETLSQYCISDSDGGMSSIEVLPSSEYKYDSAHRRIVSYQSLPGISNDMNEKDKIMRISSLLPFEAVNMIRSVGALLKYTSKQRVGIELEDASVHVPIVSIKRFTLDNLVLMDDTAFSSLRIFYREFHPSVYKGATGSKEGLSLFGISNYTRTTLGLRLLKLWFLRPLKDIEVLTKRQSAIEYLHNPSHSDVTSSLSEYLKNIKNVPRILVRMAESRLSMTEWQALYKTTYNAIYIGETCRGLPQNIDIFNKISESFSDDLHRIASLINKIVDFEESNIQNRFVVKPGVDSDLDEKKHTYNGLPDLMTRVASMELTKLDNEVEECQVIYVPQLGYLLRFKRTSWMKKEEDFQLNDMTFVFLSDGYVHYKTQATNELSHLLGDTQCEIHDHETAIMHKLQSVIVQHSHALVTVVEYAAELDCLLSLARLAKEYNYCRPELTSENVIYIKNGRHPLQELCVTTFIPNDTCIDLSNGRMKILTGANASGKSVYLTQVGLIVYLAHIGSFVPAEVAKIGLLHGIFTRIQTRESVSVQQSAFLIDVNQVSTAVQCATSNSLILLDEFGKGTATVDGLSLLTSVLRHWLRKGEECPNVLVSTHFHSIIKQSLLPNTRLIEYLTMDTLNDQGELVFLYQLVKGTSDTSHAFHIASTVGLPASCINRATIVSDQICKNEPVTRADEVDSETRHKLCSLLVGQFLNLDLTNDNVTHFLQEFVLSNAKDTI